jgi:hypothetical protein
MPHGEHRSIGSKWRTSQAFDGVHNVEESSTSALSFAHTSRAPLDAGHYAWEQAAEEYGRRLADWVDGGYRRLVAN